VAVLLSLSEANTNTNKQRLLTKDMCDGSLQPEANNSAGGYQMSPLRHETVTASAQKYFRPCVSRFLSSVN